MQGEPFGCDSFDFGWNGDNVDVAECLVLGAVPVYPFVDIAT
jgi:hypothetical protein